MGSVQGAFGVLLDASACFLFGLVSIRLMTTTSYSSSLLHHHPHDGVPGPKDFCYPPFNETLDSGKVVYLLVSSNGPCLHPTEACALESAARAHPTLSVRLVYSASSSDACPTLASIQQAYPNIQVDETFRKDTKTTPSLLETCARLLRETGGICLSGTVMTLRPLYCLDNVLGHNNPSGKMSVVQNGVMIFQAGHPFLDHVLNDETYLDPAKRKQHVPNPLTKAFQFFCNYSDDILPFSHNFYCSFNSTVGLLSSDYLHPFTSWEAQTLPFFDPIGQHSADDEKALNMARLESSFTLNFYRTPSERASIIRRDSFFGLLASSYCPLVYTTHS